MEKTEVLSLGDLLSRALMSEHNAIAGRVRVAEGEAEITFILQIVEYSVGGVSQPILIDDIPMPPKDQLN